MHILSKVSRLFRRLVIATAPIMAAHKPFVIAGVLAIGVPLVGISFSAYQRSEQSISQAPTTVTDKKVTTGESGDSASQPLAPGDKQSGTPGTGQPTPKSNPSQAVKTPDKPAGGGSSTPPCSAGYSGIYPNCVAPPLMPLGIPGVWNLIMQDEFTGSNLNAMWATQRGPSYSYGDPYNPQYEDAFYLANNPKVQDGKLVLTLNQGSTNGYPYSSGMVQNGRSWNYSYGYVEARIKVPGNTGVWPAFWTLSAPVDQSWPPEIDIFEFGLQSQTRPSFNYHFGSSSNPSQTGMVEYGLSTVNYTQDYHVYGMLWTAQKIQVYIDGVAGPSYTNAGNITNSAQYIILNLALKKGYTVPSGTAMYVDYVRVWQ